MKSLPTLLFIILLSSFPERVVADYEPPTTEMAFSSANLVFEGEVLSNVPKEDASIQGHPDWLTVATFRINKVWKGSNKKGDVIEIQLIVDPCGTTISAEPGDIYVIYAGPLTDKFVNISEGGLYSGLHYGSFSLKSKLKSKSRREDAEAVKKLDILSAQQGGPAEAPRAPR